MTCFALVGCDVWLLLLWSAVVHDLCCFGRLWCIFRQAVNAIEYAESTPESTFIFCTRRAESVQRVLQRVCREYAESAPEVCIFSVHDVQRVCREYSREYAESTPESMHISVHDVHGVQSTPESLQRVCREYSREYAYFLSTKCRECAESIPESMHIFCPRLSIYTWHSKPYLLVFTRHTVPHALTQKKGTLHEHRKLERCTNTEDWNVVLTQKTWGTQFLMH